MTIDLAAVTARREAIEANAPCEGCGATLANCKANRGKDPTAPDWFGCCAQGTTFAPCNHIPDHRALLTLLREIESGRVRTVEEMLLDSIEERPWQTTARLARLAAELDDISYYAKEELW